MRQFLHMPVGWFNVAIFQLHWSFAILFGAGFLVYEITQGSQPWLDIQSWLWGLAQAGIIWFIWRTIC